MPVDAGLASLSDNLLIGALAMYALAMFGYTVEYSFGRRDAAPAKKVRKVRVLAGAGGPDQAEEAAAEDETPEQTLARLTSPPSTPTPDGGSRATLFGRFGLV